MKTLTVKIIDPVGIHARPASKIVSAASKFDSKIEIIHGDRKGNAKSIMNLMSLAVKQGAEITINVEGADEEIALEAVLTSMKETKLI